ncbi:MAG TPA: glutathione S-transferase N-terminal domain-containing protein [Polyangia bacterium]|nr:glutathione S-transferase N-terminal domain-containing protein [Polyangia bacterium]
MADALTLVGRSSSHFTRVARMFALDLGVSLAFRPVLDMTSLDPAIYGDNPALKVPVLIDEAGALFGTENICRELARRSGRRDQAILRGDLASRLVANAEEMILHGMQTDVILVIQANAGGDAAASPKARRSLENVLGDLDAHVDELVAALPAGRLVSFCETALYCLVTHLPWRKVLAIEAYGRLAAFGARYGERASARATAYRFDAA